ncbi:uncharacterized protein Bfra_004891 [Botrytis fragariae]|uniref:Uncharacterized protein n=1 Tax=Botrytis fragariae TaxID=1964551 RepID=A0A8H6ATD9_9HELO|nr:uncharacterized protein Bfra_004891 [Botrytis fragariae]KAF5873431.1 hypothetical protein Bfra_004891 [Botrytis fragariae]
MDKFLFDQHLQDCTVVQEKTTCFETFLYADPEYRTTVTEETILEVEEFDDFLNQKGRFKNKNQGCIGGIRLILQGNAIHPNTFEPKFLSLPNGFHQKIVDTMYLPHSWIETLSAVGPFYWSGCEQIGNDHYLQIIYRKSDVKKASNARNWELVLSHSLKTGITNAFFKGTPRADVTRCITCLRQCIGEIDHPLFLPALVFSCDIDFGEDKRHRDNRERVRILEKQVVDASHRYAHPDFTKRDKVNLSQINSDLVDCHKNVLWKRPEGYITIVQKMEKTASEFKILWPNERKERLRKIQTMIEGRLELLQSKLQGISTHREVTISRLKLIGEVLENLVSLDIYKQEKQRQFSKLLSRKTARLEETKQEERREMEKTQRDLEVMLETRKQTTMSLLGILFLPGTFFAAIFSTTFFNFQHGVYAGIVSKKFYIYWAATIPTTVTLLGMWLLWQRRTRKMLEKRDEKFRDLEAQSKKARNDIFKEEDSHFKPG